MDIDLTQKLRQKMNAHPRVRGRYNSSELYFINRGLVMPDQWMKAPEKEMKDVLTMWSGIGMHNQIQELLGKEFCEEKKEFVYKDIVLVGKADYLPPDKPDELWELKTSEKAMKTSKMWHDYQTRLYCTMFGKEHGLIYQPVQNADGVYLRHLKTINRDDHWFEMELEKLYQFHLLVEQKWKDIELNIK